MTAPTVANLRLRCSNLDIFSALGDPEIHIEVTDVLLPFGTASTTATTTTTTSAAASPSPTPSASADDSASLDPVEAAIRAAGTGDVLVGTTSVRRGVTCGWEDEPLPAELYLDGRRGLAFAVVEGAERLATAQVGMAALLGTAAPGAPLEVPLLCTENTTREKGRLTIDVEERRETAGELWLSGVGTRGGGVPHDPGATYLSVRKNGVQVARSPEVWECVCGPLLKYSTGKKASLFKNWKRRWCVGSRAGMVYGERVEAPPKGVVTFDTTCVSPPFAVVREPNPSTHPEVKDPSLSYFAVQCVDGGKPLTLLLRADDAQAHNEWCSFLETQADLAEGAPSTWPVARVPLSILRAEPPGNPTLPAGPASATFSSTLELCVCLNESPSPPLAAATAAAAGGGGGGGGGAPARRQGSVASADVDTVIASSTFSAADLLDSGRVALVNAEGKADGEVLFSRARRRRPGMRDALQHLGLDVSFALDFTAGNGDPKLASSLHSLEAGASNAYLSAVRQVAQALHPFSRAPITGFGFGGSLEGSGFSSCFPLDRETKASGCENPAALEEAYLSAIRSVQLFDPRNFTPAARAIVDAVRAREARAYTVVCIVACGSPRDHADFADLVASSADLPVSFIVIGVGNGSFEKLRQLHTSVHTAPVTSPLTRIPARRANFRLVRCTPRDTTAVLASHPSYRSTPASNHPASSLPTFDLASALSAVPYEMLEWLRLSGTKLDTPPQHGGGGCGGGSIPNASASTSPFASPGTSPA
eukprot:Rhum_TRINITY_DN10305_c0_g1::Rhum_TRINITY_DN10305_c0_g1_i1::g.37814::m.37814